MSSDDHQLVHKGSCFCKSVTYQVKGLPILSAYCHCTLCQRLNGAAFIPTVHFSSANFTWTHADPNDDLIKSYAIPIKPWKTRWRCKKCGCTVASYNSKLDKWSVWAAQFERDALGNIVGWDSIKPTAHIFYESRMVDVGDELGKWVGYEGQSERLG